MSALSELPETSALGTVFPPRSAFDIEAYDLDECIAGYSDCRPGDPAPGTNHSPAFRWGWANRCRDRSPKDDGFDAMRHAFRALESSRGRD